MASDDDHKEATAVTEQAHIETLTTANGGDEKTADTNGEEVKTKTNVLEELEQPAEGQHASDKAEEQKSEKKQERYSVSAHERHERRGRGGGYRGRGGFRNNRKSAFEDQPESSDADEIRRQVEFYFSDSNLPIDNYLLEMSGGHKNKPVPLKTIHNFKRMRHFQPYSAVREAVKESRFLNLDEDDNITRKEPLSDRFTDDPNHNRSLVHTSSMGRSIYAKGFGEENKSTHLDIEAFFAPYGDTRSVRLRRKDDGSFKGSVFVEFDSEETQKQFLELDPKPQWNGQDLEVLSKQEYVDKKHEGIMDGSVKPKSPTRNCGGGRGGRGRRYSNERGNRRYSKDYDDDVDKDDWKTRRDRDNERDRRGGGRGRDRGRGRGGRDFRGRDNRRRRSRSPDFRDEDKPRGKGDENEETAPEKLTESEQIEKAATDGAAAAEVESKKRARDEDGVDGADPGEKEAKKAKEGSDEVTA